MPIQPYSPIAFAQTGVAVFSFVRRVDVYYLMLQVRPLRVLSAVANCLPMECLMLRYRIQTLWTARLLVICVMGGGVLATAAEVRPVSPPTAFERSLLPPVMDRIYHNRLEAESASWLAVYLFKVPVAPSRADDAAQFTITSSDDPAYAADRSVHPGGPGRARARSGFCSAMTC
ncbi:MAG: hypothetical protein WD042_18380 [Phycisphaeraceae bacterium]